MPTLHFQDMRKNFIPQILEEIYIRNVYEPILQGKSDLTIIDCGANLGLFSLYVMKYAKTVIAVEPSSQIYEYLEKNTKDYPIIKTIKVAVGAENGSLELFGSDENLTMFSSHKIGIHSDKSEKVQQMGMQTLLDYFSLTHVDFLKLDIEGSEFEVLASDEFLKASPKIDCIMGEIHRWTGRNPAQCVQALEEAGYTVEIISQSPILFLAKRAKRKK